MMSRRILAALAFVTVIGADRAVDWIELPCPGSVASQSCSYQNPSSSQDMAVTLFFQVEDTSGTASFQCSSGDTVHCDRSWALSEQGSAGTCFFLLKASQTFDCRGHGQVNLIGAHAVKLAGKLLSSDEKKVPCPGSSCSYKNAGAKDQWVTMSFSTSAAGEGISCLADAYEVCSFSGTGAADASSCAFLLPAGSDLSCKATAGAPSIKAAVAVDLEQKLSPTGQKLKSTCPPETGSNTTMCDCSYKNPTEKDLIVVMNARNTDGKFNSFHCAVSGVNTCAWGANNGEIGAAGQCYFILPAGASYECQMQFGATAFPSVTVVPLAAASIYPTSSSSSNAFLKAPGVPHVPVTRSDADLQRLFGEFQSEHGPVEQARFRNFAKFVALSDNHPSNSALHHGSELSSLATLSQSEFEATHRDCARSQRALDHWSGPSEDQLKSTPSAIDWRAKGAVTAVKDQGQCGSCWSFSTTGVLEGAWFIAGHGLISLSEQNLVSCDNQDGNAGCGGGWPYRAIDYVHTNGFLDTEASYPYSSGKGSVAACAASSGKRAAIRVVTHTNVEPSEVKMVAWVALHGPMSVTVDAMTQIWWPYRSGIMNTCCNTEPDHAVLVVGYGESKGQLYWLIKNSWNANWGEAGYLRLERGTDQCGITTNPVGAIVGAPGPSPPTPAPPTPPTPPTPPPGPSTKCPSDAELVSTAKGQECKWVNGTKGVNMPSKLTEYCEYIEQGYFGYSWDKAQGTHDCPTSSQHSTSSDSYFCVWYDGKAGVKIPKGAVADCSHLSQGQIGFVMPGDELFVV